MLDLSVYESGEGGELILGENDLVTTDSLYNQVYLAWFGGNVVDYDEDQDEFEPGEERVEFWQNFLFFPEDEDGRMSGKLEWYLANVALTSQGLFELQAQALEDIHFLEETAEVSVNVELITSDRISIIAILQERETQNEVQFKFIWDATQSELIERRII